MKHPDIQLIIDRDAGLEAPKHRSRGVKRKPFALKVTSHYSYELVPGRGKTRTWTQRYASKSARTDAAANYAKKRWATGALVVTYTTEIVE